MSPTDDHPRFPVIAGPTAGGKSALAVAIAHALEARGRHAEIITADSIQIFRGLDIGSAKPTVEERAGIPHHLIDIIDPQERFSVDAWLEHAERALDDIRTRGNVPIVVGGTHMYVKAFLEGLLAGPEPDRALREELHAMDHQLRRAELERVDPDAAARIHANDIRRTVRALEVFRQTGTPISQLQQQWDQGVTRPGAVLVGLDWEVDLLNQRINARVRDMIERGLLDEVRALHLDERFGPQSREALGYRQLLDHLGGKTPLDQAVERIKIETRRFAKNQRTWLRRLRFVGGSKWIRMGETSTQNAAQDIVATVFIN